jgi:hypothetical protein
MNLLLKIVTVRICTYMLLMFSSLYIAVCGVFLFPQDDILLWPMYEVPSYNVPCTVKITEDVVKGKVKPFIYEDVEQQQQSSM